MISGMATGWITRNQADREQQHHPPSMLRAFAQPGSLLKLKTPNDLRPFVARSPLVFPLGWVPAHVLVRAPRRPRQPLSCFAAGALTGFVCSCAGAGSRRGRAELARVWGALGARMVVGAVSLLDDTGA